MQKKIDKLTAQIEIYGLIYTRYENVITSKIKKDIHHLNVLKYLTKCIKPRGKALIIMDATRPMERNDLGLKGSKIALMPVEVKRNVKKHLHK